MALSSSREGDALSEINVTPLVDVMLVLLIIFMVTAPALLKGIAVDLPETRAARLPSAKESLIVVVTGDGKIFLGSTELPKKGLREKVAAVLAARGSKDEEIFLRADRRVPYGDVVRLLADLKAAGVERVGMVTKDEVIQRP